MTLNASSRTAPETFESIADRIATCGWGVFENMVPHRIVNGLSRHARSLEGYRSASIGRNRNRRYNPFVRRDEIYWINGAVRVEQVWLTWIDQLRLYLNRSLMLGLESFQSHFAHYPPGSFYRCHLDAFRGQGNRVLSTVLYLNDEWTPGDGGELLLYSGKQQELGCILPIAGTLVVFLSEDFPHEVLPTQTDRYSVAGWFRQRAGLPLEQ